MSTTAEHIVIVDTAAIHRHYALKAERAARRNAARRGRGAEARAARRAIRAARKGA